MEKIKKDAYTGELFPDLLPVKNEASKVKAKRKKTKKEKQRARAREREKEVGRKNLSIRKLVFPSHLSKYVCLSIVSRLRD